MFVRQWKCRLCHCALKTSKSGASSGSQVMIDWWIIQSPLIYLLLIVSARLLTSAERNKAHITSVIYSWTQSDQKDAFTTLTVCNAADINTVAHANTEPTVRTSIKCYCYLLYTFVQYILVNVQKTSHYRRCYSAEWSGHRWTQIFRVQIFSALQDDHLTASDTQREVTTASLWLLHAVCVKHTGSNSVATAVVCHHIIMQIFWFCNILSCE